MDDVSPKGDFLGPWWSARCRRKVHPTRTTVRSQSGVSRAPSWAYIDIIFTSLACLCLPPPPKTPTPSDTIALMHHTHSWPFVAQIQTPSMANHSLLFETSHDPHKSHVVVLFQIYDVIVARCVNLALALPCLLVPPLLARYQGTFHSL